MATTLQRPPNLEFPTDASTHRVKDYDPGTPTIGVWVGLAAITMTFAAFTSAMVVRQGSANDWLHFSFPIILFFNTAALVASSMTLQIGRKRIAAVSQSIGDAASALRALYGTLVLGCVFVFGQYAAWLQLRSEGLYLTSAPSSSFFYVFTVLHALHVIGGLAGLVYVISKIHRGVLRMSTLNATSQYWHFMGLLWLYLLFLLRMRI